MPGSGGAGRAALGLALIGAAACGDAPPPVEDGRESADVAAADSPIVPARYLTAYVFAGGASETPHLYALLDNRTSRTLLRREYRAWIAEEDWRQILSVRDTIPVPRAAWRLLPAPGFRLQVGDGGEALTLSFRHAGDEVRLLPGAPVSEWTGATGQREFLAPSTLVWRGEERSGLLFFRRAARTEDGEAGGEVDRLFLLAAPGGEGVLVSPPSPGEPGGFSTAWTWLDGVQGTWTDAVLRDTTTEAGGTGWILELSEAGVRGRFRSAGRPEDAAAGPPPPDDPNMEELIGELVLPGRTLQVRGLMLHLPLP